MEIENIRQKIVSLHDEYIVEIMTRETWNGHSYATEYLADIYKQAQDLLKQINVNNNQELFIDYETLINKVFLSENITSKEKRYIASIIEEKFLNILEKIDENLMEYLNKE